MKNVITDLDRVASVLQAAGLNVLAQSLDVVSNTLESKLHVEASSNRDHANDVRTATQTGLDDAISAAANGVSTEKVDEFKRLKDLLTQKVSDLSGDQIQALPVGDNPLGGILAVTKEEIHAELYPVAPAPAP